MQIIILLEIMAISDVTDSLAKMSSPQKVDASKPVASLAIALEMFTDRLAIHQAMNDLGDFTQSMGTSSQAVQDLDEVQSFWQKVIEPL